MKYDEIKELIRLFGKSKLNTLKIKSDNFEIEMEKGGEKVSIEAPSLSSTPALNTPPVAAATSQNTPEEEKVPSQKGELITSPMVGTFYASPSPDSPPFVHVGESVRKGQTLCILEAMKIMNEVEAEFDCKILEILVQDGEPVEYDKPLFRVERL